MEIFLHNKAEWKLAWKNQALITKKYIIRILPWVRIPEPLSTNEKIHGANLKSNGTVASTR